MKRGRVHLRPINRFAGNGYQELMRYWNKNERLRRDKKLKMAKRSRQANRTR